MRLLRRLVLPLLMSVGLLPIAVAQNSCGFLDPKVTFANGGQVCLSEIPLMSRAGIVSNPNFRDPLSVARGNPSNFAFAAPSNPQRCPFVGGTAWGLGSINGKEAVDVCNAKLRELARNSPEAASCSCEVVVQNNRTSDNREDFTRRFAAYEHFIQTGKTQAATTQVVASAPTPAANDQASQLQRQASQQAQQLEQLREQAAAREREAEAARVREQQEREIAAQRNRIEQAERERLLAELQSRQRAEEEAKRKLQQERELAEQRARQEQAEREKLLAEAQLTAQLQQRLKVEEEARRRDQAERERLLAEAQSASQMQQRLKAEEEARRKEQAERERVQAEVLALRAELEKARQAASANLAYRKALVIGIDSYKHIARLSTAREDAKVMAEVLKAAGFTVNLHLDMAEKEMRAALRKFASDVQGGDEVAFFFAGHGVQLGGMNYLIPMDVNGDSEGQVREDAIPLQRILDDMTERKAKLTLAVIDACRDNPFKVAGRNVGGATRGLAPTTPATGQMVIFSAGSGQRALDNLGPADKSRNGVFTRVFAQEMQQRGIPIDGVARRARSEVVRLARTVGHDQVPAIYDQLLGEFYLLK